MPKAWNAYSPALRPRIASSSDKNTPKYEYVALYFWPVYSPPPVQPTAKVTISWVCCSALTKPPFSPKTNLSHVLVVGEATDALLNEATGASREPEPVQVATVDAFGESFLRDGVPWDVLFV